MRISDWSSDVCSSDLGDIRPEGLQVTSGPSDRGDLHDQAKGKSQEYCADFTSRFLANTPCSRPMPRAMCSVTNSSSTPTTLKTGNSHGACAGMSIPNLHTVRCPPGSSARGARPQHRHQPHAPTDSPKKN